MGLVEVARVEGSETPPPRSPLPMRGGEGRSQSHSGSAGGRWEAVEDAEEEGARVLVEVRRPRAAPGADEGAVSEMEEAFFLGDGGDEEMVFVVVGRATVRSRGESGATPPDGGCLIADDGEESRFGSFLERDLDFEPLRPPVTTTNSGEAGSIESVGVASEEDAWLYLAQEEGAVEAKELADAVADGVEGIAFGVAAVVEEDDEEADAPVRAAFMLAADAVEGNSLTPFMAGSSPKLDAVPVEGVGETSLVAASGARAPPPPAAAWSLDDDDFLRFFDDPVVAG